MLKDVYPIPKIYYSGMPERVPNSNTRDYAEYLCEILVMGITFLKILNRY